MQTYTKGEWEVLNRIDGGDVTVSTFEADGCSDICYMNTGLDAKANARRIVQCVNGYDELYQNSIHITELIKSYMEHKDKQRLIDELDDFMPAFKQALKNAGGGK